MWQPFLRLGSSPRLRLILHQAGRILFVTMERMSDALPDLPPQHRACSALPAADRLKSRASWPYTSLSQILSMGHMIASLCAMGRDDASSGLLTAGSPEIVRPGREHHRITRCTTSTGPPSRPQKHVDSCVGQTGADMCRSTEASSNVGMVHGFNIPSRP